MAGDFLAGDERGRFPTEATKFQEGLLATLKANREELIAKVKY
jgi:hypothetical protein